MKKILLTLSFLTLGHAFAPPVFAEMQYICILKASGVLQDKKIEQLQLLASSDGRRLSPIPFQIDEKVFEPRSGETLFVLDHSTSRRYSLEEGNARFDGEDELVWFKNQGGVQVDKSHFPSSQVFELSYLDRGAKKFVYIVVKEHPPHIFKNKVSFDEQTQTVQGETYLIATARNNSLLMKKLILRNGSSPSPNILDRFKIRLEIKLRKIFSGSANEENITSHLLGYKTGPIRVLQRLETYKTFGLLRISPKSMGEFQFFPNHISIQSFMTNPIDPKHFSESSRGFLGFDFNSAVYGMKFISHKNPNPVLLDGKMSPLEQGLVSSDNTWWVLTGAQGTMILRARYPSELKNLGVHPDLYYKDDKTYELPPESFKGTSFIGFYLDPKKIPKGKYSFQILNIFPPLTYRTGLEKDIFSEFDSMMKISVSRIK